MVRSLTRYYSVLILDRAIEAGINRYGIDIRAQLELALNDIKTQNSLLFQESYISRLQGLKVKYR